MHTTGAPLAWVPWVPGNLSIFEQWVPETINFREEGQKFNKFSVEKLELNRGWELEVVFGNLSF